MTRLQISYIKNLKKKKKFEGKKKKTLTSYQTVLI